MAQDFNRRFNIYINGERAAKSLKELQDRSEELKIELSKTTAGTADFIKKSQELEKVEKSLSALNKKYEALKKAGKTLDSLSAKQTELAEKLKGDLGGKERAKLLKELRQTNQEYAIMDKAINGIKVTGEPSIKELRKLQARLRTEIESGNLSLEEQNKKYAELQEVGKRLQAHRKKLRGVNETQKEIALGWKDINRVGELSLKDLKKLQKNLTDEIEEGNLSLKEQEQRYKELQKIDGILDNHRNRLRGVSGAQKKITGGLKSMVGLAAAAFTAQVVVDYGKELFTLGTEMEVLEKKAKTVFGEALPLVTRKAEENAAAMGLTVGQYVDASAAIGDLLILMGFARDEAVNISTNLVDLSGALSEWTGGQVSATEVTDILGKAMLGEREQLKGLGISISEADVKARLAEKGLSNLTGEMLQQAKAAATLELITEKSGDAQAAFAANSDTLVRKQAELQAKFQTIKEELAQALIPVFHRLLAAATPIITTFADLVTAVIRGDKATSKLSGGMKIAATVLGNAGKIVLFALEAFTALGNYLLTNFGGTIEFIGGIMIRFQNLIAATINKIGELTGLETRLEPINIEDFKASLESAKKTAAENKIVVPTKTEAPNRGNAVGSSSSGNKDALLQQASKDAALEKQREKAADKEAQQLKKRLERLQEIQEKFSEEAHLKTLSEEDKKIAQLAAKFDEQITVAKELEAKGIKEATAQRIALERLKNQELLALQNELFEQEQIAQSEREALKTAAELEALNARETAKREAEQLIKEEVQEILFSERQQVLLDLETQFQQLLELANEHGIDTLDIEIAFRQRKSEINAEFDKKDKDERVKAQQEQAEALVKGYESAGKAIGAVYDAVSAAGLKNTVIGKGIAIAHIGIESAKAIASATAAAAGIPFPGNIAAIAGSVATVVGNIAQAKKILSQKKKGGYHQVTGADDGISYNAQYIGQPQSGMLPSTPVVLASEAGAEYFVSNRDLQNPVIANYTRIIDNISKGRTRQFVDGGFNNGNNAADIATAPATSTNQEVTLSALLVEINRLNAILESGIISIIPDDSVIAIRERFNELNELARGSLG